MKLSLKCISLLAGMILCCPGFIWAQWAFEVVENHVYMPWVAAGDFDNDGDPDLLCMANQSLIWCENLHTGWLRHTVDQALPGEGQGVFDIADIDGDGDPDFTFSTPGDPGALVWYESMSSSRWWYGLLWKKHVISSTLGQPGNRYNCTADMDGDGDSDVVASTRGQIIWFENFSAGTLWIEHAVANIDFHAEWTTLADLDGDQDPDIIAADYRTGIIMWYENNLPDSRWKTTNIAILPGSTAGRCADVDNDGDIDLITYSDDTDELMWYSNPDWIAYKIDGGLDNLNLGSIGDIDSDGDPDITFCSVPDIGWCENTGNGTFWNRIIIDTLGSCVVPGGIADVDSDLDYDIIVAIFDSLNFIGDVRWYANPLITSVVDAKPVVSVSEDFRLWQNYPNPFNPGTTIRYQLAEVQRVSLTIFDINGKVVRTELLGIQQPETYEIFWDGTNTSGLPVASGVYFYTLDAGGMRFTQKMILSR